MFLTSPYIDQTSLLKNSFQGISPTKFIRKLLNVRSPWALKFTEITALVPFSTATDVSTQNWGREPVMRCQEGIRFTRVKTEETERSESDSSRPVRMYPFTQLTQNWTGTDRRYPWVGEKPTTSQNKPQKAPRVF